MQALQPAAPPVRVIFLNTVGRQVITSIFQKEPGGARHRRHFHLQLRHEPVEIHKVGFLKLNDTIVQYDVFIDRCCADIPVDGANVLLTIRDKVLSMNQAERGHYVVQVEDFHEQSIAATAQAELNGVFLGEKTVAVNLPPVKNEMTSIELDEKFLRELAEKLDGKYFYADRVSDEIGRMFEAQTRVGTSRSITSVWPSWPLLAVLCVILGVSWFIRRAIGLV